jgi:hypothetical protein
MAGKRKVQKPYKGRLIPCGGARPVADRNSEVWAVGGASFRAKHVRGELAKAGSRPRENNP